MGLKLFACGDVVNSTANKFFLDDRLMDVIQSSDFAICNFEAPIKNEKMIPVDKAGPHLYQSVESVQSLKEAGFNFVSLANNHIYDYGQVGLCSTIDELNHCKIEYIGAGLDFDEAYKETVVRNENISVGLLAACENEFGCLYEAKNRGGYAWLFHERLEETIQSLKLKCDFVVLIAHAGLEDVSFPIKEWRARYKRLCDIGVDVVVGHHPHVPQGYESYKDSLIFYSLGNFYFDTPGFVNSPDDSFSVILHFRKNTKVAYEIIYHRKINLQTCLLEKEEVSFDLKELNAILSEGYEDKNNEISLKVFKAYYQSYYEAALGMFSKDSSTLAKLKAIFKALFLSKREESSRGLLLLHNIRIETHRFVVQRALSIMFEKS